MTPALERMLAPETLRAAARGRTRLNHGGRGALRFPDGPTRTIARAPRALEPRCGRAARTSSRPWPRSGRPASGTASAPRESRRDVALRAEAAAKKNTNVSAEQITKDVDDAHRQKHEELKLSTRAPRR